MNEELMKQQLAEAFEKEREREYNRMYYEKHKEENTERCRRWKQKNREKWNEYQLKQYHKRKEKMDKSVEHPDVKKLMDSVIRLDNQPKNIPVYFSEFEVAWLARIVKRCKDEARDTRRCEYYGAEHYIAGMNELLNRLRQALKRYHKRKEKENE